MKRKDFLSLYARGKSFGYAFDGFWQFFKSEPNAWIHLLGTIVAIGLSLWLRISEGEWALIVIAIGGVWTAELFNTAIEKIMDHLSPQKSQEVKFIKDISAAAVLVTALTAFIIACFILIPKI